MYGVYGIVAIFSNVLSGRLFDYVSPAHKQRLIIMDLVIVLAMIAIAIPAALNYDSSNTAIVSDYYFVAILFGINFGASESFLNALLSTLFPDSVEVFSLQPAFSPFDRACPHVSC